jgi:hypothetical protein
MFLDPKTVRDTWYADESLLVAEEPLDHLSLSNVA